MSDDTDRIPVPTNGTGPHAGLDMPEGHLVAKPVGEPPMAASEPGSGSGAVSRDQTGTFSPNQLAAGFGIVAGLLLFFAARRRRGRG